MSMTNKPSGTKFQGVLKRYGYKYEPKEGKLIKLDSADGQVVSGAPKKSGAKKQKAGGEESAAKKRKLGDGSGRSDESTGEAKVPAQD